MSEYCENCAFHGIKTLATETRFWLQPFAAADNRDVSLCSECAAQSDASDESKAVDELAKDGWPREV